MTSGPEEPVRPNNGGSGGAIIVFGAIIVVAIMFVSQAGLINVGGASSSGGGSVAASSIGAKFVREAKKHDDEAYVYGGGHPPSTYKKGSGLDCSGLVSVVVLKVTGVNQNLTVQGFLGSKHWKKVKLRDAKTGDILYILRANHPERGDDHMVLVVKNRGSKRNPIVFEAYGSRGIPYKDQIQQSSHRSFDDYDGALRWRHKK